MRDLSKKYGKHKPFRDDELVNEIVALTYPEIRTFFNTYVYGETPIPYNEFLQKVGLRLEEKTVETGYFLKGKIPYFDMDQDTGEFYFRKRVNYNSFLRDLGVKGGDVFLALNGTPLTSENIRPLILASAQWKPGREVSVTVERDGIKKELTTLAHIPTETVWEITKDPSAVNSEKTELQTAWLKD